MERIMVRCFRSLIVFCILPLVLGGLSAPRAGAPTDSLWLKAVSVSDANSDLVPGSMRMYMQEVDKHGEPKNVEKYNEVWSRLSLGEDGRIEYETVKAIESGKDITEERKSREERERARGEGEKDGDDEDSDSYEMRGYSPFGPDIQDDISIENTEDGGIVEGRNTMVYDFVDRSGDDVVMSGRAWVEVGTGIPVRLEYTPDPLPKRVKRMATTIEYEHMYPDSLIVRHMFVEVTGGILFIKKHFHMNMTFDEYWRLPEGYGTE
jgi:hypothetical protein